MALADTIEKLVKLPNSTKAIVMVVVCAIIGGGFYFMVYSDLVAESEKLDRKVTQLKGEKNTYEERKQKYDAFRAEVSTLKEEQKELLKVLPDEANISTFLESIHAQAELAGVQLLSYAQGGERRRDFYAEIPVNMAISGTYHQICKFFYFLERDIKRIIKVENVALTAPRLTPEGMVLKVSFVASTYRFVGKRPG